MKKFLFVIALWAIVPAAVFAQLLDSTWIYYENFNGTTSKITTRVKETDVTGTEGRTWAITQPAWAANKCMRAYHTKASGDYQIAYTKPIPYNRSTPFTYLQFDHICKVYGLSDGDNNPAYILIQFSSDTNAVNAWSSETYLMGNSVLSFNATSETYFGNATTILQATAYYPSLITYASFSDKSYSTWVNGSPTTIPTASWWKNETIRIDNELQQAAANITFFRVAFIYSVYSPTTGNNNNMAGWFVDNIRVINSNADINPPKITLQSPYKVNDLKQDSVNNYYEIKALISDWGNDTLNLNSISFKYKNGKNASWITLPAYNSTTNRTTTGHKEHQYTGFWRVPKHCIGDTIYYTISATDMHGNTATLDTNFRLVSNFTNNVTSNDAWMRKFHDFPFALTTGQSHPVKVSFANRSQNLMTSLQIGWSHNGVQKTTYNWTAPPATALCMEERDTVILGNIVPVNGHNYIKAWVIKRNGANDNGTLNNDTIYADVYSCDSALNGTYTVGDATADFPTIAALKDKLANCGIGGNVVINLKPGTYSDFTFDQTYNGQSQAHRITFQAENGNRNAVIIQDNSTSGTGAIVLNGVGFYTFHNLTIKGKTTGTSSRGVTFLNKATTSSDIVMNQYITISNCKIEVNTPATPGTADTYTGIYRLLSTANKIDRHITIKDNIITGGNYGINYKGTGTATCRNQLDEVTGNEISAATLGIVLFYDTVSTVSHNTITQIGTTAGFRGIDLENIYLCQQVSGNTVKNTSTAIKGIYLATVAGTSSLPLKVANNEVNICVSGSSPTGIELANASNNVQLLHNSVRLYATANLTSRSAGVKTTGTGNNQIVNLVLKNNILVNEVNGSTETYHGCPIELANLTTTSSLTADYNLFYSPNGVVGYYKANRSSLEQWCWYVNADMQGGSVEDHGMVRDPGFAHTDSCLELSIYDGLEVPMIPGITEDIRGIQRKTLTYFGAYTIVLPDVNIALIELVSPLPASCPQNTANITLKIRNVGGESINFNSTTSKLTIQADISGGYEFHQPVTVTTGSLNPLETRDVIIKTNAPLGVNDPIYFKFVASIAGDTIHRNDTLEHVFLQENVILNITANPNEYDQTFSAPTLSDLSPAWKSEQISGLGNWKIESGTGSNPTLDPTYGGGRLFLDLKNSSLTTTNTTLVLSRAIMPAFSLVGSENPTLNVWFAHDKVGTTSIVSGIVVKVSIDGGNTFTALRATEFTNQQDTLIKRYHASYTTAAFKRYIFNLNPYIGQQCVIIAIDGRGLGAVASNSNLNIDRVYINNVRSDDFSLTDLYSWSEAPTKANMSMKTKVRVVNVGAEEKTHDITLKVSGANTYTETVSNVTLPFLGETVISFNGTHLNNNGNNVVTVFVSGGDNNKQNDTIRKPLTTYDYRVNFADTSTNLKAIGGTAGTRLANRYNVAEEIITNAVRFYPVSITDNPVGKKVYAFVSDLAGNVIAQSDTLTLTAGHVNTWVELPMNQSILSNVSDCFFAGIHLMDAGNYIGAQVEAPMRDSAYYTLGTNKQYTPQVNGRAMIGAVVEKAILNDMALLSYVSPVSNCDLGHENVTLNLTNYGSQTIPAGTVFHLSVNNSHVAQQTMTEPLPRLGTTTFTFSYKPDFTNTQVGVDDNYQLKVWIEKLTADRVPGNDTLEYDFISRGKANMPTVSTPINVPYSTSGTLTATFPPAIPANNGVLSWYQNVGVEQWQLLGQGNTFLTPEILWDTAYYVNVAQGGIDEAICGTGTVSNSYMFNLINNYSKARALYRAIDLGNKNGYVAKIFVNVELPTTPVENVANIKIYLKNTDLTALTVHAVSSWTDEISGALLVYDGPSSIFNKAGWNELVLPELFKYTGQSLMILTESTGTVGTATNICKFISTNVTNTQDYRTAADAFNSATFSTSSARMNVKFSFADILCPSEKVPIQILMTGAPNYDLETMKFLPPTGAYGNYCTLENEHPVVILKNRMNSTIPANKVKITAIFNGTPITYTVDRPILASSIDTITFPNTFDFKATTADITWNYTIFTDLLGESIVFRNDDTIKGNFKAEQTDWFPDEIDSINHPFATDFKLQLRETNGNYNASRRYWVYNNPEGTGTPLASNVASFTTPVLYDDITYWVKSINLQTAAPRCSTKMVKYTIHLLAPQHDLKAVSYNSPNNYECGLTNAHFNVDVQNTRVGVIPANTFKINANLTGTSTKTGSQTITVPIDSLATHKVIFNTAIDLTSPTQNNIYNYVITVQPTGNMPNDYKNNDTLTGVLKVPALPNAPTPISRSVTFGNEEHIVPSESYLNYFYFYDQNVGGNVIGEGTSFTTPPIRTNTTYYYSGRIRQPEFAAQPICGTGTTQNVSTFSFTTGTNATKLGQAIQLYEAAELNDGYAGYIDTVSIPITHIAGSPFPVKFYILNDSTTSLATAGAYPWATLVSKATLIFDGETDFGNTENIDGIAWFKMPVQGGFYYTGHNILLLIVQDCNGESCYTMVGNSSNTTPNFRCTSKANFAVNRLNSTTGTENFAKITNRINTRFSFTYTCPSPRSPITLTTVQPACDLQVANITAPITPNDNYSTSEQVTVSIKNWGTTAASNFPVTYCLEGKTPVTETYTNTIAAGGTGIFTFAAPIDLTDIYFPEKLTVSVRLACDNITKDDTLILEVQKPSPCKSYPLEADKADISNVTIADLNNGPGLPLFNYNPNPNNGRYTNYTQTVPPVNVVRGQSHDFSITNSFTTTAGSSIYRYIYVDLNRDNTLATNENLFSSTAQTPTANNGYATISGSIYIPDTAALGLTLMRIITASTTQTSPCAIYTSGETEDYAMIIHEPYNIDPGIVEIVHPSGEVCPDSSGRVRVRIKNHGTSPITFSETMPMTLTATLRTATDTVSYTQDYTSGTILPDETTMFAVDHVNWRKAGTYAVSVSMTYPPDEYVYNNVKSGTVATVKANTKVIEMSDKKAYERFDYEKQLYSGEEIDEFLLDTALWTATTTPTTVTNFKWSVFMSKTDNAPNAGPLHDHTTGVPSRGMPEGWFAAVSAPSNASTTAVAYLTTACLNLHYENGYPKKVSYWEHIYAKDTTASVRVRVEVGSGNNFIPIDEFTGPTQSYDTSAWLNRYVMLNEFDEIAKVRFIADKHSKMIDPALDDIRFGYGYPDLGIDSILFPKSYKNVSNRDKDCISYNDTIYPVILIHNYGTEAVYEYDIQASASVGDYDNTITEHVSQVLMPGDTMYYTLKTALVAPSKYSHCEIVVRVYTDFDENSKNDEQWIISCIDVGVGVEDILVRKGYSLGQNIPNPANGLTQIPFSLPEPGQVTFQIHTIEGQTLYNETQFYNGGEQRWNYNTASLPSGIYLYTMHCKDVILTRKMVVER
ncbi:MAG: GEVED domain-containing protein [Bacteroidales bacterium]|jgi:hypothetical protein|nr:GEVED domain-containing protein [Bacteroidales bacterium]